MISSQDVAEAPIEGFRLSPQQERLWWLQGEDGSYHARIAIQIDGPLDLSTFLTALREVVDRHEILRTSFRLQPGTRCPLQVIRERGVFALDHVDLSALPIALAEEWVLEVFRDAGSVWTDLFKAPLLRAWLVRLSPERRVLLLRLPALCADFESLNNLFTEIVRCYNPHEQPAKYANPMPYAQFSEWQRQLLELDTGEEAELWLRRDLSHLFSLVLPGERPRPAAGVFLPRGVSSTVPPELNSQLDRFFHACGVSPETFFLSCWLVLIWRLTGRNSVGMAVACGCRSYEDLENALGLFEKFLPMELTLDAEESFLDLLPGVRNAIEENEDWQEYFDGSRVFPGVETRSFLPIAFEYREAAAAVGQAGPVKFSILKRYSCGERFRIKLVCWRREEGYRAEFQYDPGAFDEETIECLAGNLETLLHEVLERPDQRLGRLEVIGAKERRQVLVEYNETARERPADRGIQHWIEGAFNAHADRPAVVFEGREMAYGELDRASRALAHRLMEQGIGPDALVGVWIPRSLELIIALVGILRAGAAYLPLDPESPAERLEYMLDDSGVCLVVTAGEASWLERTNVGTLAVGSGPQAAASSSLPELPESVHPHQLIYGIYTSGSTGRPKAALNTHAALLNRLLWMQETLPLTPEDRVLHKTPYSFDVSAWELFWPLMFGARLIVARPSGHRDPKYLADLIQAQQVTTVHFVPSMLQAFLAEPAASGCRSLRLVVASGEALPAEVVHRAQAILPAEIVNLYGPTEAAIDVTAWRCEAPPESLPGATVPIGRPISNLRTYVLDGRLRPALVGVGGQLYLAGTGLARGYLGRPALTAESFIPDPFSGEPGGRLYATGDRARWNGKGVLEFMGRLDEQVKIRGMRVEPGEIEALLLQHPQVRNCVVRAETREPGGVRLVAWIEPQSGDPEPAQPVGASLTAGVLRRFLASRVPEHLIPQGFFFVQTMPRLPSGKIDRLALPAKAERRNNLPVPPRNERERLLVGIWRDVLEVEVGIHDDFLELGGDSILSLQIAAKAASVGVPLIPGDLLQHRTIADLAQDDLYHPPGVIAEQGALTGPLEMTPVQRWFFEQRFSGPEHWNQAVMLEAKRPLDGALLCRAACLLEEQHDALRLRFQYDGRTWRQQYAPVSQSSAAFVALDLTSLETERHDQAVAEAAEQIQASLDFNEGPIWRLVFLNLGERQLLLIVAHHLAVDGVSWRILLEDLEVVYDQLATSSPTSLPLKTTSLRQWATCLSTYAQGQDLTQQLDYWLALPWQEACRLPVDWSDSGGRNTVASARSQTVSLNREETELLLRQVPRAYRTEINDVLLTALARTISRWTGASSLLVDLEGHGRESLAAGSDLSRTVGWLTSLFPLVIDIAQGAQPGPALMAVKELLRGLPDHGLGFGVLRYLKAPGEAAARLAELPKPEILFNYLGQFDAVIGASNLLRPAAESPGPVRAAEGLRSHLLDVEARIWQGCLEIHWTYSENLYRTSTIEGLAALYMEVLRALIGHCLAPGAGGYTASDFPLANLSSQQLNELMADVGGGDSVEDLYPLAGAQEGMLVYLLLQDESSTVFLNQLSCRLEGTLGEVAFQRAWQQVLDRHASVRTQFVWQGIEQPLQVVRDRVEVPWTMADLRHLTPDEQAACLERQRRDLRAHPMDLRRAPLLRLSLSRTAETEWHFTLTYQHLVLDGWSVSLLLNEVMALYEANLRGQQLALPPTAPYRDYVVWLRGRDWAEAEAFWRGQLQGLRRATRLRIERPAEPSERPSYGVISAKLDREATERLAAAARDCRVTVNTLIQAAWALLLHRYSGRREVAFGAVVSGRQGGFESTLGLFINALPVRTEIPADGLVIPWLERLQASQVESRRFEFCPLEQIQRWSELPREERLFDTLVVFENYPVEKSLRAGGALRVAEVEVAEETNYPLSLFAFPGDELELNLHWRDAFDAASARLLLEGFEELLGRLAERPDSTLTDLLSSTARQREELLDLGRREQGRREHGEVREALIPELVARQAQRTPNAVAVISEDCQLTYEELEQRASELARLLTARGAGPETMVAVRLERSPALIVALLAILETGAAYLPLDVLWPAGRVRALLADAGVKLLLADPLTAVSTAEPELPGIELLRIRTDGRPVIGVLTEARMDWHPPVLHPRQLAYGISTSGTTKRPRLVAVSHGAMADFVVAAARMMGLGSSDRILQFASPAFDASVEEIFAALVSGSCLVLREDDMLATPETFLAACQAAEVTVLDLPTSYFSRLVRVQSFEPAPFLRLLVVGGEKLRRRDLDRWWRLAGKHVRVLNTYGPTEATVVATSCELRPAEDVEGDPPIGLPRAGSEARVLDASLAPVPVGVPGQLHLGGDGLARGYLRHPALTAASFIPDPWSREPGARLYRTGDVVRWMPDGQLRFLGRQDRQVKIRGYRVEPREVEALLESYPAVAQAAVCLVATASGDSLSAYVLASKPEESLDLEALRRWLRQRLPEFMVPSRVLPVTDFPRTAGGKIDYRQLSSGSRAGAGGRQRPFVPPRNEAEEAVAEIFEDLLGTAPVGAEDDFFDLGGHSLLATQLVAQIREVFEVDLPLRLVFEAPTVTEIAARIAHLILQEIEEEYLEDGVEASAVF